MKNILATILIALAVLSIYFGSYLPFSKARRYISALRLAQTARSVPDFEKTFDSAIEFYSPIGDEEIMKFLGMDILNVLVQQGQSETLDRWLVGYVEPNMIKSNVRHLIILGQMYTILWRKYGSNKDYLKSEEYQIKALEIGPNLPPVLYGLLDLYQAGGDKAKLKKVSETIVKYWPEDEGVQRVLSELRTK